MKGGILSVDNVKTFSEDCLGIYKIHEDAMIAQKMNNELEMKIFKLQAIIDEISRAIEEEEIKGAESQWRDRKDVVNSTLECSKLKRIIGMKPEICEEAEAILQRKENGEDE